jgi:hypothetical protein
MESFASIIGVAALAVSTIVASVSVWLRANSMDKSTKPNATAADSRKRHYFAN